MENENTKKCMHCGEETLQDGNFCPKCGKPLIDSRFVQAVESLPSPEPKKKPFWKKPIAIVGVVIFVIILVSLGADSHEWVPATCSAPQTCAECGKTKGDALEHDWVAATCEAAKICKTCQKTEGEALGHSVSEWKSISQSTCTVKGKQEGYCTVCQKSVVKELDLAAHTKGNWEVTKIPTKDSKGTKSLKCSVCKAVMDTQEYELSAAELKAEYKKNCKTYSYDKIARSPGEYKGKNAKFYGKVVQVMQEKSGNEITYTLRIGTGGSYYYDDIILCIYTANVNDARILEDDMITIYGELRGEYSYETVMGNEITLPFMSIEYIN